ncbi:MAG: VWA domain-containing protein [Myxococcaceae bacterium]
MTPWRFSILGYKAGFAQPWFLLGVLVAGLLGAIALWVSVRRTARLAKAVPNRLAEVLAPGVSVVLPSLQSSAYTLALIFFALALAQPQCGEKAEVAKRRGIDVVVALDASKSMYARDVTPSRIDRARLELTTLLDSLKGDRVGIVAFAGDAFIQCPLTSDYAAARLFLRAIDPESMPQGGTNIGAALLLSRQVLENADGGAKDRVVVLLSDGEDLEGAIGEGIDALKDLGAQVLAVGIGSETGEPIPILNRAGDVAGYKKDENGVTVLTRLDRAGLTRIATATGGQFFYQPRGVAMADVVKVIDGLQKSELESRVTMKYGEVFQPFVAIALVFLALGFLIIPSWRRRGAGVAGVVLAVALFGGSDARAAGPFERNDPEVEAGTQAYDAQKFDEALEKYDAAAKQKPSDPRIQYNRGLALYKLNRNEEAAQAFQSALDLDRKGELAGNIHYNLGNVYAAQGDKQKAIAEYRAALRKNPDDPLARHNLEVLLKNLPPKQSKGGDAGADGGGHDGGSPDAGQDGGPNDAGSDAGRPDGGKPDGGDGDAGASDAGMDAGVDGGQNGGDGGQGDGGRGDGGEGQQDKKGDAGQSDDSQHGDAGSDGGIEEADAGMEQPQPMLPDGGADPSKKDAEKLLDSMKSSEKNLQLWRFKQKTPRSDPRGKDW